MITPELKDHILNNLTEKGVNSTLNINHSQSAFQIPREVLEIILDQFESLGLLQQNKMLGGTIYISLTADAFDFSRRGGFTSQEALFKAHLDKLRLELENLKKDFPEKSELFTSILSNLAVVASLFVPR